MTTTIYHYVYRITNTIENKHYYGARTSKGIIPEKDIGVRYTSSSKDKQFILDQRERPDNFKYKVIRQFKDRVSAIEFEILLHNKFDVGVNENFYNRAKQTSSKFDTTGISHLHTQETIDKISKGNKGKCLNMIPVKDTAGNYYSVDRNDSRYLSGELVGKNKGMVSVKDIDGNSFQVEQTDSRIGITLFGVNKGVTLKSPYPRKRIYVYKDKEFNSAIDLSVYVGVKRRTISNWCNDNLKTITEKSFNNSKFLFPLGREVIGKTFEEIGFRTIETL